MCGYCGCSTSDEPNALSQNAGDLSHGHAHDHDHGHDPGHSDDSRVIELGRAVMDKNARLAERARGLFMGRETMVMNLVSSPGSGKTTLLQKTVAALRERDVSCAVIVGDCATDNDARRLRETGVPAVQVTTGNVCHLDAHMVLHAVEDLNLAEIDVLFIENVGNLVCPAAFDLGEDRRVVLTSVTEGEDKPKKYPPIFHNADAVLLTKIDLAGAVELDRELALANIRDVAPRARILEVSGRIGEGMDAWLDYVRECRDAKLGASV